MRGAQQTRSETPRWGDEQQCLWSVVNGLHKDTHGPSEPVWRDVKPLNIVTRDSRVKCKIKCTFHLSGSHYSSPHLHYTIEVDVREGCGQQSRPTTARTTPEEEPIPGKQTVDKGRVKIVFISRHVHVVTQFEKEVKKIDIGG